MQFIDLNAQQQPIRGLIEDRIKHVLDHGKYILGPEVKELEETLAEYVGVPHAVGVASGTDALLMALMAYDIGPGDAVFTVPFTFVATAEVIQLVGAQPVFVDIDPDTWNLDAAALEQAIVRVTEEGRLRPRCVMPVDIFGQAADYAAINAVAKRHGLVVLEDMAQSFGAMQKDRRAGSLGDIAGTSFFPAKPLGAYGDGGMIFAAEEDMREKLCSLRVHGQGRHKYENVRTGVNGRLDTLQAAILLAKFTVFPVEMEKRQIVAARYAEGLGDVVTLQQVETGNLSAWAQYSVRHPRRDDICAALKEQGIPTAIYYPVPLHLQPAYADLSHAPGDFPISEALSLDIFSLPFHPYLPPDEQDMIIEAVRRAAKRTE
jgi:UDP-2-acetamido-2-deoxy-ribo-hexuluronate aminotransferase